MTNENDRELMELAALAAGYDAMEGYGIIGPPFLCVAGVVWDPLADDGDALRLAAQLNIDILHVGLTVRARVHGDHGMITYEAAEFSQDRALDIRRSIVRAAAHIGKQLKEKNHA